MKLENKKMKLRGFKAIDVYPLSKMSKKLGIDFKEMKAKFKDELGKNKGETISGVGMIMMVQLALDKFEVIGEDFNAWLATLVEGGASKQDIEQLDLMEYGELLRQLKDNDIVGFISLVLR